MRISLRRPRPDLRPERRIPTQDAARAHRHQVMVEARLPRIL